MKTIIIIALILLFLVSIYLYCCKSKIYNCSKKICDEKLEKEKNLCSTTKREVKRDAKGRYSKKK
tara:strand:+ start:509 stop:703 length:195 start_codon:yes stop_codon:yes gene_type:complete